MLVVDLGVGHGGNIEVAKRMLRVAQGCGAMACKLQCYSPALWQKGRMPRVPRSLSAREIGELIEYSHAIGQPLGITIFTKYDMHSQKWPTEGIAFAKIACNEFVYPGPRKWALEAARNAVGLPCYCGQTHKLVVSATDPTGNPIIRYATYRGAAHLLCVPCYPCPPQEVPLRMLRASRANKVIGYSDHTGDVETLHLAMAATDCLIEVHHNSEGPWGYDWRTIKALVRWRERLLNRASKVNYKAVARDSNGQRF